MPLASDPIQPNGTIISGLDTSFNVPDNELASMPQSKPLNADTCVAGSRESTMDVLLPSHLQNASNFETEPTETTEGTKMPPEFRRMQAVLRGRKKMQTSVSHRVVSSPEESVSIPQPQLERSTIQDSLSIHNRRRGSRYTIDAKSSFLSGMSATFCVHFFYLQFINNMFN